MVLWQALFVMEVSDKGVGEIGGQLSTGLVPLAGVGSFVPS